LSRRPRCSDDEANGAALLGAAQTWAHDHLVPLNATIELTQRCNIRCKHCYNFDRDQPKETVDCTPELSREEILQLITDLREAGCLFLTLTGGEALLHPDLPAFLDHAASLNLAVQLLTNGVLLRPGVVGQLSSYPNLLRVCVSLYGADAEVHDGITQAPGSFERTWAGIHRLRAAGIAVRLKFVIMRDNAHQVAEMQAQARSQDLVFNMDLTVTARHDGTAGSLDVRVQPERLEPLLRGPLNDLVYLGGERRFTDTEWACNCARGNCAITARGDVQPCIAVPMAAGNIRKQPFAEIWRSSPVFRWIRELRIEDYKECAPCSHRSWCTRERGAAYTHSGSYTGIDPMVCARAEITHRLATEARDGGGPDQSEQP
jgi:AdoMet-dependent heme synthase